MQAGGRVQLPGIERVIRLKTRVFQGGDLRQITAQAIASTLLPLAKSVAAGFHFRRSFVLLPFSLIFGLVLYCLLWGEPQPAAYVILVSLVVLGLGSALWAQDLPALRLSVQLVALVCGFCLLPAHAALFGTEMLRFPAYGAYQAVVDEVLGTQDDKARVVVSAISRVDAGRGVPIRRARVILPAGVMVAPGDTIEAAMRFAPIPGPVLPGAHDGQFHSYFSGIGAYGTVTSGFAVVADGEPYLFGRVVQGVRNSIAARIDGELQGATAAIGKAMVVGDQSQISDETREVMAASGLAHIYSISGLHLSIVAGGLFWLVRWALACVPALAHLHIKKLAALAGVTVAFLYLQLAGGLDNVPAFRSTLMLVLVFGAVLAGRQALTMRNVAIAALVIVVIDPASVFRPSFQLSFAAVVALIGIYEMPSSKVPQAPGRFGKLIRVVTATAWTSLIAGGATLLFSAYHFQQTAPLGVLGNVLALPFVSLLIMPFGVVAVLAMPLGLDGVPLQIMGWGIDRMVDVAELVAGWSSDLTGNPLLGEWTLVAGLVALAGFAFQQDRWRFLVPSIVVPIILIFGFEQRPDVLIADTTQAVAIRDGDGLALVTGRTGSFAVSVWEQHYQLEIASQHAGSRCDGIGCVASGEHYSVATIRNAAAFAEDCFTHDLVISRIRVPSYCREGAQVIGPDDLARGGVHSLVWNKTEGRFDVRPAMTRINRPWRVTQ